MTTYEIIQEIQKQCGEHDVEFEINSFGLILRKFGQDSFGAFCFKYKYSAEILRHIDIQDLFEYFEDNFNLKIKERRKGNKNDE